MRLLSAVKGGLTSLMVVRMDILQRIGCEERLYVKMLFKLFNSSFSRRLVVFLTSYIRILCTSLNFKPWIVSMTLFKISNYAHPLIWDFHSGVPSITQHSAEN